MDRPWAAGLILAGSNAFAVPVLRCSTSGYGLANMVVDSDGYVSIQFTEDTEEVPTTYVILQGLGDVNSGKSATLIAQEGDGQDAGGTFTEALLLRVLDGQKSAYLSVRGNVHKLRCY